MERLPVLISIPHGGDQVPAEVRKLIRLSESDIFDDGDSLTRDLFGFHDQVEAIVETTVTRMIVDLNRHPDERPLLNPNGVIKTVTTAGAPVYHKNKQPGESLVEKLMDRYYYPYHHTLAKRSEKPGVRIALDCHSMPPHSAASGTLAARKRPAICLSNCENSGKNGTGAVSTCPASIMSQLAECFTEAFELPEGGVLINDPLRGGHIIRSHYTGRIPWVQVAINKNLYLQMNKRKRGPMQYNQSKVDRIKAKIWIALNLFFLNFNGQSL